MDLQMPGLIFAAGLWAGMQNALAGGGSFVTLPALILAGLSPLAANMTSAVALFPGQVVLAMSSRRHASGVGHLPLRALFMLSLVGGALGGVLLIHTPSRLFSSLVPWLVLFATAVFAWGSFRRKPVAGLAHIGPVAAGIAQFFIAVYGGYFGGGIGFLMLACLTMAGLPPRTAAATKNTLAGVMNAAAVVLFAASLLVNWRLAVPLAAGALLGGVLGARLLVRIDERALKVAVVCIGVALTIGLFLKQG